MPRHLTEVKVTGPSWHRTLAEVAGPYVAEGGFTVVALLPDATVLIYKSYPQRSAAWGQATRLTGIIQVNTYVLTRHDTRVVLWTGRDTILARLTNVPLHQEPARK